MRLLYWDCTIDGNLLILSLFGLVICIGLLLSCILVFGGLAIFVIGVVSDGVAVGGCLGNYYLWDFCEIETIASD